MLTPVLMLADPLAAWIRNERSLSITASALQGFPESQGLGPGWRIRNALSLLDAQCWRARLCGRPGAASVVTDEGPSVVEKQHRWRQRSPLRG